MPDLIVRTLGLQPYEPVWQQMQQFTAQRQAETPDEIWLLQHHPVFTQGQAGKAEHLLNPGPIPVVKTDRGGQVTYHGPGQLIAYLLLDLRRKKLGVRDVVTLMEEAVIALLADHGQVAVARADAPGVYVDDCKIASLGLRVRRGCSFHGLALNVDMDLQPFARINPCGYAGMQMTQLRDLCPDTDIDSAAKNLLNYLVKRLDYPQVELANHLES
ncbi:lipoyl(octanoyl) transferase LipB [Nitrincola iocasae]|uniref:Octanoyltransferase n=2 Tax=Nitrincola iocasae TaxID=2614693 RepID=A0A5J6LGU2_9GAMM|nr:lipoyl(octanoyl) transferase LipB [Nitrincola iocasae]QEW07819.1 lipoyl(octanoyl) transferase LipB [Nitrincola iocasae]